MQSSKYANYGYISDEKLGNLISLHGLDFKFGLK